VKYAVLAEKAARRAEEAHNWDLARTYWERKARWHEIAKDEEQRRAATIAAAETYIRDADERIAASGANHLTAAVLYQDGIEALRRVGGMQERVTQLHKALLAYQEKGVSEMGRFSAVVTIDNIEDYMERARAQVRGRPLPDALLALAFVASPPKVSTIEQHIKETLKQSPVWDIFPRTLVNERGRTQKRIPTSSSGPEGERAALETEMFGYAVELRRARVLTSIEPAREQVNLDHNVRVRDFAPLIVNNAFVPIGREGIFARGLHAGLVGDFLVATHLLIPQLDHSIRTALESRGAIVSGLEDDGTQPERGLNTTLAHAEATLVLGEDIVFDLRGLLVEKAGSNMRHAVAHGLVDEGAFHTTEAAYIWWISLHLCTLGRIQGPGGSDAG
jgi:hypothetical protein